jgi:hypothetical protein
MEEVVVSFLSRLRKRVEQMRSGNLFFFLGSTFNQVRHSEEPRILRGAFFSFINIKSAWIPKDSYPRPQNLPYPARVLSSEGRFMRRSEVGQSESLAGAG